MSRRNLVRLMEVLVSIDEYDMDAIWYSLNSTKDHCDKDSHLLNSISEANKKISAIWDILKGYE